MDLASASLTRWLALKPTDFDIKHYKVIQGHRLLYRPKTHMRFPIIEYKLTY